MSKRHFASRRRAYGERIHDLRSRPAPRPERPDLAGLGAASRDEGAQPEASDAIPVASHGAGSRTPRAAAGDLPVTSSIGLPDQRSMGSGTARSDGALVRTSDPARSLASPGLGEPRPRAAAG